MNNILNIFINITIFLIVIVFFLIIKNTNNFEGTLKNPHTNFLKYPGKRNYCPSMPQNKAITYFPIPNTNLKLKLCCNSCYQTIIKDLHNNGVYSLDKFNNNDIKNLNNFYKENNLSFIFPETKLRKFIGNDCLKKNNLVVQIL
tara:strand:+ start:1329 stop:1760 length:432 start_codon:yes stop_codon:yes gene_type:complete